MLARTIIACAVVMTLVGCTGSKSQPMLARTIIACAVVMTLVGCTGSKSQPIPVPGYHTVEGDGWTTSIISAEGQVLSVYVETDDSTQTPWAVETGQLDSSDWVVLTRPDK